MDARSRELVRSGKIRSEQMEWKSKQSVSGRPRNELRRLDHFERLERSTAERSPPTSAKSSSVVTTVDCPSPKRCSPNRQDGRIKIVCVRVPEDNRCLIDRTFCACAWLVEDQMSQEPAQQFPERSTTTTANQSAEGGQHPGGEEDKLSPHRRRTRTKKCSQ